MLVLSRKVGEEIRIGNDIVVRVNRVSGGRVSIGVEAPDDVKIVRGELERVVNEFHDVEMDSRTVFAPSDHVSGSPLGSRIAH